MPDGALTAGIAARYFCSAFMGDRAGMEADPLKVTPWAVFLTYGVIVCGQLLICNPSKSDPN